MHGDARFLGRAEKIMGVPYLPPPPQTFRRAVRPYPFMTPIGTSLATFREMPDLSATSTTSSMSL